MRQGITKRVRKKNKLNEILRIIKALKLIQATSENLKENHKNYDHLKIVTLIKGADNVFEKTLKDIKIVVNVKKELESYKTSSYEDFTNHFYREFEAYYTTINDQTLEMLQNIDENDTYNLQTEFDLEDQTQGSILDTPHKESDGDLSELINDNFTPQKDANKFKKEDFDRSTTKEKILVETLLEMQRLRKFDIGRLFESIEEKIKENNQMIKTFLVGGMAEKGRLKNVKCLEIFFKYIKEINSLLVEIIYQAVKESVRLQLMRSAKEVGNLASFFEDLYDAIITQNKMLLNNVEKILHSFFQENMSISEVINTAKL